MSKTFKARIIILAGMTLMTTGCDFTKLSGAKVKTLDNFAAGKRVYLNECTGDPRLANDPALGKL